MSGTKAEDRQVELLRVKLSDLMDARRITGITDIRNESTDDDALLTVQLKRDADAKAIVDVIRRHLSNGEGDAW